MTTVTRIAQSMKSLFGCLADKAAGLSKVILRRRKLTPQGLASTFVLGFLNNPNASDEELAQMAAANGEPVTPQAIEQRHHPRMVNFLRKLFELAVHLRVTSDRVFGPLMDRFTDVQILDSTTIALPLEMALESPGCGGSHGGTAAMKLQVRMSLKTGCIDTVRIEAGRDCDGKTPLQKDVPIAGSLRIADLGYFNGNTFEIIEEAGAYWISPWMTGVTFHDVEGRRADLLDWLKEKGPVFDGQIRYGAEKRLCRMIAWRLPPEVAARRRRNLIKQAQKKDKMPSRERLDRCDWAILITNLPLEKLSFDEARVLYRSRWQIELLFKRWKSQGRICELTGSTWIRCMIQLWSRLLAAIVQQWLQCGVWGRPEISLKKFWDTISNWAIALAGIWRNEETMTATVERILATAERAAHQNKRKSRSTFEMVADPSKLTYKVEAPVAA
jgi:Transposase DDE domain